MADEETDTSTPTSSLQENEETNTSTPTAPLQENDDIGGNTDSDKSTAASLVQQNENVGGQQFPAHPNIPEQTVYGPPLADQAVPVARRSGSAQYSNVATGISDKRHANRYSPIARPARGTTAARGRAPFQSPISTPIPPQSPLHIPQDLDRTNPQSVRECFLCEMDLSLTQGGVRPARPPDVAVLPCGHHFHTHCLRLITPADQSEAPACIVCHIAGAAGD